MTLPEAIAEWVSLKLWIWYYNMQLTPEERAENKAALAAWEKQR